MTGTARMNTIKGLEWTLNRLEYKMFRLCEEKPFNQREYNRLDKLWNGYYQRYFILTKKLDEKKGESL